MKFYPYQFLASLVATSILLFSEQILAVTIPSSSPFNQTELIPDPQINISQINLDLQQLYDTEQYSEIIKILEQALLDYQQQNDLSGQMIASRNLALAYERVGDLTNANHYIQQSVNFWKLTQQNPDLHFAQILDVQGQIELTFGNPNQAVETWLVAANIYKENNDIQSFTQAKINQIQALRTLGLYNQALRILSEIDQVLLTQPDDHLKAMGFYLLGDVYYRVGQLENAANKFEQALTLTGYSPSSENLKAQILIGLGDLAQQQKESKNVQERFYDQAVKATNNATIQMEAKLKKFSLLTADLRNFNKAKAFIPELEASLAALPTSRNSIYSRIHFAEHLSTLDQQQSAVESLSIAVKQATEIGDRRAQSYGLGSLGKIYEAKGQYSDGQQLTEKALKLAQEINAPDLIYQWQWQLGRIFLAENPILNRDKAVENYIQSVQNLQAIRSDLVAVSSDNQFSFRDNVEPVYRELAGLLLREGATQAELAQARDLIESLQLAELDNFFRDACLDAKPVKIDDLDPTAAIFYPIILEDRLELIVALPGEPLINYRTEMSAHQVNEMVETQLRALTFLGTPVVRDRTILRTKNALEESYKVLIKPIEEKLQEKQIKTLVFIPDGVLGSMPFSALYDGEKYLIERYAVALAPSLQLIDPTPLAEEQVNVFSAGLSEARQGFIAIPGVEDELIKIRQLMQADVLLNESFTESQFNTLLEKIPYDVVHLATHGEFSSNAEDTFILTWDEKINVNELNALLRGDRLQYDAIELLVLSACQTAAGDKRAALGLAGMAVRAGARSTVASLWSVDDAATSLLMTNFYKELATGNVTKSEALRRAQVSILEEEGMAHPYYWSAFVMLGNWL